MQKLDHVLSTTQFADRELLEHLFAMAQNMERDDQFRALPQRLRGRILATVFYEPSTRTRFSFEASMQKLGGGVITAENARESSSAAKGETIEDAIKVIAGYADVIALRHFEVGAAAAAAKVSPVPIINAGDGAGEHPTQALLDARTILDRTEHLEGLRVAIIGDIRHSRVARSTATALGTLGTTDLRLVAPEALLPEEAEFRGAQRFTRIEDGIVGADVVMMLRIQKERMAQAAALDDAAYFKDFGLTAQRLKLAAPSVLVMHPGPMNRGVEISSEVADGPRSGIREQVNNGVAVRMAVLASIATTLTRHRRPL